MTYMFYVTNVKLSDGFIAAVKSLPQEYSEELYMNFIKTYGTHHIEEVHMGSRISCINRFTEEGWRKLLNKNYTIKLAATGSSYDYTGAADKHFDYDKKMIKEFNSARSEMKVSLFGAAPVKGGNTKNWEEAMLLC